MRSIDDAHAGTDIARNCGSLADAIRQSGQGGRKGALPFDWDMTSCVYSDDDGAMWKQFHVKLISSCPEYTIGNCYGAVEPTLIELRDGHMWMLIRTEAGFLNESDLNLNPGQWHTFKLAWSENGKCAATLNDSTNGALKARAPAPDGLSYLRLRSLATGVDPAGILFESVHRQGR